MPTTKPSAMISTSRTERMGHTTRSPASSPDAKFLLNVRESIPPPRLCDGTRRPRRGTRLVRLEYVRAKSIEHLGLRALLGCSPSCNLADCLGSRVASQHPSSNG